MGISLVISMVLILLQPRLGNHRHSASCATHIILNGSTITKRAYAWDDLPHASEGYKILPQEQTCQTTTTPLY